MTDHFTHVLDENAGHVPFGRRHASEPSSDSESPLVFDASIGRIYGIFYLNLLLSFVTFGIYRFWGKVRMRRYMFGSVALLGDRFAYRGTGLELFLGFLKWMIPFTIFVFGFVTIFGNTGEPPQNESGWPGLVFLFFLPLYPLGVFYTMRFRLSRTTWRGVRCRLRGKATVFLLIWFLYALLTIVTLGIALPWLHVKMRAYLHNHASFGSAELSCGARGARLFGVHIITLLLAVPTASISRFWYTAALHREMFNNTQVDGAVWLRSTYSGGSYALLKILNFLIILFTLGIAYPNVIRRNQRYFCDRVSFVGNIDTSRVMQSDEVLGKAGEGATEFFEIELDIG